MLLVIGEHDQANETAHAEDHLLAREDCIAGAARDQCKGNRVLIDAFRHVPKFQKADPNGCVCTLPCPHLPENCPIEQGPSILPSPCSLVFLSLYSQYSSLLRAGTEVALHLSLVHPIQGEHHKDTPKSQCPESVPYKRIWIQPATDANWSLCLSLSRTPTTSVREEQNRHCCKGLELLKARTGWTCESAARWRKESIPPTHSLIPNTKNILPLLTHQSDPCDHSQSLQCQLTTRLTKAPTPGPLLTAVSSSGSRMGSAPRH